MQERRSFNVLTAPAALALSVTTVLGCAGSSAVGGASTQTASSGAGDNVALAAAAREEPGARGANLAGGRCRPGGGAPCKCRNRAGGPAEDPAPDDQHKRFEIRMFAEGGSATLDSPTLGHFAAAANEACFYVDVVPGSTSDVTFTAREAKREEGVGPYLEISEYGPKGPWWYRILEVKCAGPGGHCNRDAADAWSAEAKTRKRGRIDPCGSAVISHLAWDTSGGTGNRELGMFRDFIVKFTMEVKRFATQFPTGSTECVPK